MHSHGPAARTPLNDTVALPSTARTPPWRLNTTTSSKQHWHPPPYTFRFRIMCLFQCVSNFCSGPSYVQMLLLFCTSQCVSTFSAHQIQNGFSCSVPYAFHFLICYVRVKVRMDFLFRSIRVPFPYTLCLSQSSCCFLWFL